MYLSTFVDDSVDIQVILKSLKFVKIDDFDEIWSKNTKIDKFWQF